MSPQEKNILIISIIATIMLLLFANYMYENYKCDDDGLDKYSGFCKNK